VTNQATRTTPPSAALNQATTNSENLSRSFTNNLAQQNSHTLSGATPTLISHDSTGSKNLTKPKKQKKRGVAGDVATCCGIKLYLALPVLPVNIDLFSEKALNLSLTYRC